MTVMNGRMNGKKDYVKPEEVIVNDLIRALESGVNPWRKEWDCKGGFRNVLTGKAYRGSNPALLCIRSALSNWHFPLFIGGGQARSINCTIKKGSKSARVLQPIQRSFELKEKDENGESQYGQFMSYKAVPVFNVQDVKGLDNEAQIKLEKLIETSVSNAKPRPLDEKLKNAHDRLFQWENQVKTIKGGDRAYYRPTSDEIVIPRRYNFKNDESYLMTYGHEAIHSTLHKSRLDRQLSYNAEELVAELGSCLLAHRLEISNIDIQNHAAYLEAWCPMLKSDPKILFKSLANASKAADMVIGEQ